MAYLENYVIWLNRMIKWRIFISDCRRYYNSVLRSWNFQWYRKHCCLQQDRCCSNLRSLSTKSFPATHNPENESTVIVSFQMLIFMAMQTDSFFLIQILFWWWKIAWKNIKNTEIYCPVALFFIVHYFMQIWIVQYRF